MFITVKIKLYRYKIVPPSGNITLSSTSVQKQKNNSVIQSQINDKCALHSALSSIIVR